MTHAPLTAANRALASLARAAAALALVGLVGACGLTPLYSRLTEQQANEIVAVLMNAHIDAEKQRAEDGSYSVRIERADLPRAVEVLHNVGHPRESFQNLGEVFKKEGFVSSPTEERARWIHARQQELAHTLYTTIDGVIAARVHLAIPERDPLVDKMRPSSAAVVLKHEADINLSNQVAAIKALLVNSVEGLPYENVTVSLFPARNWPAAVNAPAPAEISWTDPRAWGGAAALVVALLAAAVGWRLGWLGRLRRRLHRQPQAAAAPTVPASRAAA